MLIAVALFALLPAAALFGSQLRSEEGRRRLPLVATSALAGVVFGVVTLFLERFVESRLGLPHLGEATAGVLAAAYLFFLVAPLEQAATALALLPNLRSKRIKTPHDAFVTAVAAATGFGAVRAFALTLFASDGLLAYLRPTIVLASHVVFVALWGYTVARARRRTLGGAGFGVAFVAAIVFRALVDYLVVGRSLAAAAASSPLVISGLIMALLARRELLTAREKRRKPRLLRVEPPSIDALRHALRKGERPLLFRWILLGALVTIGVMVTCFAGAIFLGLRLGVDFSVVDQASFDDRAAGPLVLIGLAVLTAFPISGFMLARASGTKTVLEPALASGLAFLCVLVLLGFAAPITVAFAIACAPIGFALTCVGAWVGVDR